MPGDKNAQYGRNLLRASASVATARVSVRKTELDGLGRVRPKRPDDLDVIGLIERREIGGRDGSKRHVRFPRLRNGADNHFAVGDLRKHDPSKRLHLREQPARPGLRVRSGAEDQFASLEDGPDDR